MTSIHDSGPGSRDHKGAGHGTPGRRRYALARRKDELEMIIAAGRIGYCRLDRNARVLGANSQFRAYFGCAPDAPLDWGELDARVDPRDRASLAAAVDAALDDWEDLDVSVRVPSAQHGERWIALHGRVVCGEESATRQLVIVARDASAQHRALESAAGAERRDRFLLELSSRLARSGDARELARIAAVRVGELLQAHTAGLHEVGDEREPTLHVVYVHRSADAPANAGPPLIDVHRLCAQARAGRTVVMRAGVGDAPAVIAVPLFRKGVWAGLFSVSCARPRGESEHDVSLVESAAHILWQAYERQRRAQALALRRERSARAVQAAGFGVFEWNVRTGEMIGSAEQAALFGLADAPAVRYEEWMRRVCPEDRERVKAAFRDALEKHADVRIEYRVLKPQGGVRWLRMIGRAYPAADGRPLHVAGLNQDITPQKQDQDERAASVRRERELRGAAEQANRSKDEFLSMFSHELRSPLNAILGWNRILAVKRSADPEVTAITARIERGAKTQLKMVNDLFDLGRISTGKLKIEPRPLKLRIAAGAALDAARPAAVAKGITLDADLAAADEVYGDPERLQQVAWNLLSNAIKFTESGGHVGLSLRRSGERLELSVTDSGQGMAPELLPHVFDRFRQGDISTTRRTSGLGLGLALVREIVALHGGSVAAHSDGPGRGSTFTVELPVLQAHGRAAAEHGRGGMHAPPHAALTGLSILVVDDEADARAVVAETLRLEGAEVTVSDSAGSAFEELQAEDAHFDVVVTDIGMPIEDGYSLLRKLRRTRLGRHIVTIALTGYASRRDREAALEAGFDAHVSKPVDFDDFVPLIRRMTPPRMPAREDGRADDRRM